MIRLGLRENRTAFRPGEIIEGAVLWEFEKAPSIAEVRLIWFTRGKGTEDGETAATVKFENPTVGDTRQFSFTAPNGPYTFSGTLIALIWAVEFVSKPGKDFERIEIVIAPESREILLPKIPQPTVMGLQLRARD